MVSTVFSDQVKVIIILELGKVLMYILY